MSKEIKPVEISIEESEVVKRYKITEAMEIVRCRTAIFFHSTCFWVVSKPTMANNLKGGALFETLQWYCDYMDERDTYTEEEQERYDTFSAMIVSLLTLPLDAFTDMDFCIGLADMVLEKRNAYYTKLTEEAAVERPETLEDALENAAFEAEVAMGEQLVGELGELAKRNAADKRTS